VDIVSTNVYHEVIVKGGEPSGNTLSQQDFSPFEKHYFISSTASAANALTLLTQFEYVEQYLELRREQQWTHCFCNQVSESFKKGLSLSWQPLFLCTFIAQTTL
jgi:hypothetical protein